ncbi:MAG: tetratricopeptide repeat protein [Candidatus Acidiferrales bacterium]
MVHSARLLLLAAIVAASLPPSFLKAQPFPSRSIQGTVRDEQGRPLAGATIVLRGPSLRREQRTGKDGKFSFADIPPERYFLLLLRNGEIVWSRSLDVSSKITQVEIDLRELRQAAVEQMSLDAEGQRRRQAEKTRQELDSRLFEHYNRGALYLQQGEPAQAIEEYRRALELDPVRNSSHALLASALTAAGRLEEAQDSYRRALELEPAEAAHHNNLAALLVRSHRLKEALYHFQKAVELDPQRAATFHFNMGAALLNAGQATEALPPLRQAARSDPAFPVAQFFLGTALIRTSITSSADLRSVSKAIRSEMIAAFERYLELAPDGDFAARARDYLQALGASSPVLLPPVSVPEPRP